MGPVTRGSHVARQPRQAHDSHPLAGCPGRPAGASPALPPTPHLCQRRLLLVRGQVRQAHRPRERLVVAGLATGLRALRPARAHPRDTWLNHTAAAPVRASQEHTRLARPRAPPTARLFQAKATHPWRADCEDGAYECAAPSCRSLLVSSPSSACSSCDRPALAMRTAFLPKACKSWQHGRPGAGPFGTECDNNTGTVYRGRPAPAQAIPAQPAKLVCCWIAGAAS